MYVLSRFGSRIVKSLRSPRHRALCAVLVGARKKLKLSQHDLAKKLKTSQTVVARIEIGERRVDVVEFLDIAAALKLDARAVVSELMR